LNFSRAVGTYRSNCLEKHCQNYQVYQSIIEFTTFVTLKFEPELERRYNMNQAILLEFVCHFNLHTVHYRSFGPNRIRIGRKF
jgi:hypothetical protein